MPGWAGSGLRSSVGPPPWNEHLNLLRVLADILSEGLESVIVNLVGRHMAEYASELTRSLPSSNT